MAGVVSMATAVSSHPGESQTAAKTTHSVMLQGNSSVHIISPTPTNRTEQDNGVYLPGCPTCTYQNFPDEFMYFSAEDWRKEGSLIIKAYLDAALANCGCQ